MNLTPFLDDLRIRLETPGDYRAVEVLARDSSLASYDEPDTHLHVHKTRKAPGFLPQLSFVAETNGKLAGMVMYTRSEITANGKTRNDTLCLQHLRVAPWAQCQGVGKALMRHTIPLAREMGFRAILFYGVPDYYPRLGFRPAFDFGIGGGPNEHFFCMPLYDGALDGLAGGEYRELDIPLPKDELDDFNQGFPAPDMSWVKPVELLLGQLHPPARQAIEGLKLKHLHRLCRKRESEIATLPGIDAQAVEIIRRVMRTCHCGWGAAQ